MSDETLQVGLDSEVAECGDAIVGTVTWGPLESAPRSIRIELSFHIAGQGESDGRTVSSVELDGAIDGSGRFELPVPAEGPITFAGSLISVSWTVDLVIDRRMRTDPAVSQPVTVLPRGGLAVWARRQAPPPPAPAP